MWTSRRRPKLEAAPLRLNTIPRRCLFRLSSGPGAYTLQITVMHPKYTNANVRGARRQRVVNPRCVEHDPEPASPPPPHAPTARAASPSPSGFIFLCVRCRVSLAAVSNFFCFALMDSLWTHPCTLGGINCTKLQYQVVY